MNTQRPIPIVTCPHCSQTSAYSSNMTDCPYCGGHLAQGALTTCKNCEYRFNPFHEETMGRSCCPSCNLEIYEIVCELCGTFYTPPLETIENSNPCPGCKLNADKGIGQETPSSSSSSNNGGEWEFNNNWTVDVIPEHISLDYMGFALGYPGNYKKILLTLFESTGHTMHLEFEIIPLSENEDVSWLHNPGNVTIKDSIELTISAEPNYECRIRGARVLIWGYRNSDRKDLKYRGTFTVYQYSEETEIEIDPPPPITEPSDSGSSSSSSSSSPSSSDPQEHVSSSEAPTEKDTSSSSCPCDPAEGTGTTSGDNGCVDFSIVFGRTPGIPSMPTGKLILNDSMLTADLRGVAGLKYDHPFDRRINAIQEVGIGSRFSKQYGFDQSAQGAGSAVNIITQKGFARSYGFDQGKSTGRQLGSNKPGESLKRRAGTNQYEETLADGTIILYGIDGTVSELTTPSGITVTRGDFNSELQIIRVPSPSHTGIGMGKIGDIMRTTRNNPGQIRQIWNRTDGLLDIIEHTSPSSRTQRYTINWYAPEAVGPYNALTKLYPASGTPVKQWSITTEDADYSLDDNPTYNGIENSFDRGKMVTYPSGGNIPNATDMGTNGNKYGNRTGYTRRALKLLDIVETRPGKTPQSPTLTFSMRWEQPDMYTLKLIKGSGDDAEICLKRRLGAKGGRVNSFLSGTSSHAMRSPMMDLTYKSGTNAGQHIFSRSVSFDQTSPDGYITAAGGKQIDETVDTKYYFKGEHNPCNLDQAELVTREIYKRYEFGETLVSTETGYGSPGSQRTVHIHDTEPHSRTYGRVLRQINPDGSETLLNHDNSGRVISRTEPWAGGGTRITRTTWSNLKGFEHRPATETVYIEQNGIRTQIGRTLWHYENTPALRRETVIQTGIGLQQPLTTVWEHYGPDTAQNGSASPHAAGRLKKLVNADVTCTLYQYHNTTEHGALYKIVATQCGPGGMPVSGLSTMQVSYIDDKGRTTASQSYVHMGTRSGSASTNPELWYGSTPFKLISQHTYEHDYSHKTTKTTDYAGRSSTAEWICKGPLSQTDENGITTTYAYNSAKQLQTVTRPGRTIDWQGRTVVLPGVQTLHAYNALGGSTTVAGRTGGLTGDGDTLRTETCTTYDKLGRVSTTTDQAGLVTAYAYSADGLTTTVTTPTGATHITTRHPDGSVLSETGTGQQARCYNYALTPQGLVTQTRLGSPDGALIDETVADILGNTLIERQPGGDGTTLETVHTYDALGRLVKTEQTGRPAQLLEYDTLGNIVRSTDKLVAGAAPDPLRDRITTYTRRHIEAADSGAGLVTRKLAELPGRQYWHTCLRTTETLHNYSGGADITTIGISQVSSLDPDLTGLSCTIDKHNRQQLEYTARGITTTQPPQPDRLVIDAAGTLGYIASQAGSSTTTQGNAGLVLTARVHSGNYENVAGQTHIDGLLVADTSNIGQTTHHAVTWNSAGSTSRVTDPRGNTTTIVMDRAGRTTSTTDPAGAVTRHQYHTVTGLLTLQTNPDNTEIHYTYDHRGRKTAEHGTAVQPVRYEYDEADRLVKLHTYRGDATPITADPSTRTDADTTQWAYDPATGLLTAKTYPDATTETYCYNNLGQLASVTKPSGRTTLNTYDWATGKTLALIHTLGNQPPDRIDYTYDKWGNLLTARRGQVENRRYRYTAKGDLDAETFTTERRGCDIIPHRDLLGRSTGYTLKINGETIQDVTYERDALERISAVTCSTNRGTLERYTYGYHPVTGHQQTLTYPNGIVKTMNLEAQRSLPAQIDYRRQGVSSPAFNQQLGWNNMRQLTAETRTGALTGTTLALAHEYNQRGELALTRKPGKPDTQWQYDNAGNRATHSADGKLTTYRANNLNQNAQMQTAGSTAFVPAYDADGSQTRIRTVTGDWDITHAPSGRISRIGNDTQGTDYQYDAYDRSILTGQWDTAAGYRETDHNIYLGNLVIARADNAWAGSQNIRQTYLWDPTQPIATRPLSLTLWSQTLRDESSSSSGSGSSSLSDLSGSSDSSAPWEQEPFGSYQEPQPSESSSSSSENPGWEPQVLHSLPTALITTGTQNKPISTHYYIHDHNKNVVGLLDVTGTITAAYEYDPYGQITSQTGPVAGLNPYRYSSELHNPVTGMVDYLYRTYNPLTGKWTQRDPIAEEGGINLYGFVENNPVNYFDNFGLMPKWMESTLNWFNENYPSQGGYNGVSGKLPISHFEDPYYNSEESQLNREIHYEMVKMMDLSGYLAQGFELSQGQVEPSQLAMGLLPISGKIKGTIRGVRKLRNLLEKRKKLKERIRASMEKMCLGIWKGYDSLKPVTKGCKKIKDCAEIKRRIAAWDMMIAGRQTYLRFDCDRFMKGSIKKGYRLSVKRHEKALTDSKGARRNCKEKLKKLGCK